MQETPAMTWNRLKEKLRAHGMPGWCDDLPERSQREERALQLAIWEGEGGRTAALVTQRQPRLLPFADGARLPSVTHRLEGDVS
jgi:hypothetical protein